MGLRDDADEALMSRYRDGDAHAFEALYARHRGPLYRYLMRQCSNAATAEEMFQDVWTNVIRARERYQVRAKFTTWLYRIAHNRVVDHHRSTRPHLQIVGDDEGSSSVGEPAADPSGNPERRVHAQRQLDRLGELIGALPDEQREAFLLHEEGGLGIDGIAEVTGVGRETAKSRLRYAVSKLRKGLGGEP